VKNMIRTGTSVDSVGVSHVMDALRREADVRTRAWLTERSLRSGKPLLLGPFLGEIGYELEYWIPFLRRELHRHGIPPEQAIVVTRGGAALWYRDFAAGELDVLELVPYEDYLPQLEARRAAARDLKQLRVEDFDRKLVALARERLGDVAVVHPGLMFTRLRGLWYKGAPLDSLWHRLEYRQIDADRQPGMPADYVAVKAYFNEVLPPSEENRAFFRRAVERLAEQVDVVLLVTGMELDDHEEWATEHPRVHQVANLLRPEDNLAVQTRIVAGARGLVATYGGFSYLGPFLGVPTLTFLEIEQTVPIHLEVLHRALPGADYEQARAGDDDAVSRFSARVASASPRAGA
jgi:hypothetical protein